MKWNNAKAAIAAAAILTVTLSGAAQTPDGPAVFSTPDLAPTVDIDTNELYRIYISTSNTLPGGGRVLHRLVPIRGSEAECDIAAGFEITCFKFRKDMQSARRISLAKPAIEYSDIKDLRRKLREFNLGTIGAVVRLEGFGDNEIIIILAPSN